MQEKDQNLVQPVGICGRLYSFIVAILTARRLASHLSDSSSSNSDTDTNTNNSESEVEFWEAEDSTTSEENSEVSEELLMSAREGALQKGTEEINQIEANSKRELHLIQELGMYDSTSLSLVQEKTDYRISAKFPLGQGVRSASNGVRIRETTKLEANGSPEMMRRTHSTRIKNPKERSEEVGPKTRRRRILSRVFSNINEKSDAFIRSRRDAMKRSHSTSSKMS